MMDKSVMFERHVNLCNKIVFLDGISGTGKSVLLNFLSSLKNGEVIRYEHIYEYLCILHHYHKIKTDAAVHLMKLLADVHCYNQMLSRNANFRWGDQSCVLHGGYPLKYVKRLLTNNTKENSNSLNILTHQILPVCDLAFKTFNGNLYIIEMTRHPVYLFDHWFSYMKRYGNDKYDFTLWVNNNGYVIPWFADGRGDDYVYDTVFNNIVYSLDFLFKQSDKAYNSLKKEYQRNVLFIPFEKFVLCPDDYIKKICELLGTSVTWKSKHMLRKENCPRKQVADVPNNRLWRRYGNKPLNRFLSDDALFNIKKASIEKYLDSQSRDVFRKLCSIYENKFIDVLEKT